MLRTALKAQVSPLLGTALGTDVDSTWLSNSFLEWKRNGDDSHYVFGKDAFNRASTILRHVHMVPLQSVAQLAVWDRAWQRYSRRTSDRYLFYADGGRFGYLLIFIVDDPGAHEFLSNPTASDRRLLRIFEAAAERFIDSGEVQNIGI